MGIYQDNMRAFLPAIMISMLLVGVAVYAATEEVQDLGSLENTDHADLADSNELEDDDFDDEDLGESDLETRGRAGAGYLSTHGSFTLRSSGHKGGDEDLGDED